MRTFLQYHQFTNSKGKHVKTGELYLITLLKPDGLGQNRSKELLLFHGVFPGVFQHFKVIGTEYLFLALRPGIVADVQGKLKESDRNFSGTLRMEFTIKRWIHYFLLE